jgi:hypothetical protein
MIEPRCSIKCRLLSHFAANRYEQVHIAAQNAVSQWRAIRAKDKPSSVDGPAMINGRDRFRSFSRCDKYDFVDKAVLFRGGANVTRWHKATSLPRRWMSALEVPAKADIAVP